VLKLYENQIIKDENLINFITSTPKLHKFFKSDFNKIRPDNYCGFFSFKDTNHFIIPKICKNGDKNLDIFIYMILYAYDIDIKNIDNFNSSNIQNKLLNGFIKFFANNLLDELKKGIYKEYITLKENLKVLRGKYLVEKNFNNFYHQNIFCQFDEFSMDNKLNQFFLYAIKIFKRYSTVSNLYKCEAIFDEVSFQNIDIQKIDINFNRLNNRFKTSFEIALLILKKLVPLTQKAKDKSFAFMFDMAEVFEKFIGKLYCEIDCSTKLQAQKNFGNLQLKPDIITNSKIIDTKYKLFSNIDDLKRDDKYQMFVYGINFKVKDTMLLYPKHILDVDEKLKLGKGEDLINLELKSIDLDFDGEYDEFIEKMKKRLEEINE